MPLKLTPEAEIIRDHAKRCVPPGQDLDLELLVSTLFYASDLKTRIPEFIPHFQVPREHRSSTPERVPLSAELIPIISLMARRHPDPIDPETWFVDLLWSQEGMAFAEAQGLTQENLQYALSRLRELEASRQDPTGEGPPPELFQPASGWRASEARTQALGELNDFGRMLTDGHPPKGTLVGMEEPLQAILRALVKRNQRSALVVGQPGTGKTALIREVARRLMSGHPGIPKRLREYDLFELSPTFLRSGATLVGEYDERVAKLIQILRENPKVLLFVDEVHSLLQSGIHERGNFTDANEAFKQALSDGEISLIGATTTAEYRYYLEGDKALVQRFSLVRIDPPTPGATLRILQGRREEIETFYGVEIPPDRLSEVVDLTEEFMLGRAQPRKSIQLLDEACAYCVTRNPPLDTVSSQALWQALEDTVGHSLLRENQLTEKKLLGKLTERIRGQEETLGEIARAFVSGLGGWVQNRQGPRGVFLFGGPTGVGKTETAVLLGRILGDGRESVLRVDCNTLQPSGTDSGQAVHVLLGPPPGYIGYVRGQGGLLSRIRDHPASVVLFDEIEKADPGVGEILLQIMDSGRAEDTDGNLLDFRRSFLVFTTNSGAVYDEGKAIGFDPEKRYQVPHTDVSAMRDAIKGMGLGEEFLGRIDHVFVFDPLRPDAVREILESRLAQLQDLAEVRGYALEWDGDVVSHLSAQWQPRFGVRHLLAMVRNRIVEQLSVADAQGELKEIRKIRLEVTSADSHGPLGQVPGPARRRRNGSTLVIALPRP